MRALSLLMLCWVSFGIFGCGFSDSGGSGSGGSSGPKLLAVDDIEILDSRGRLYSSSLSEPRDIFENFVTEVSPRQIYSSNGDDDVLYVIGHNGGALFYLDGAGNAERRWLPLSYAPITSFVADSRDNLLYTTAGGAHYSFHRDGSNSQRLFLGLRGSHLDVDFSNQKLYWTRRRDIYLSDLDGSSSQSVYVGNQFHSDLRRIIFLEGQDIILALADSHVMKIQLYSDQLGSEQILQEFPTLYDYKIQRLFYDDVSQKIYWFGTVLRSENGFEADRNYLFSVDYSGNNFRSLAVNYIDIAFNESTKQFYGVNDQFEIYKFEPNSGQSELFRASREVGESTDVYTLHGDRQVLFTTSQHNIVYDVSNDSSGFVVDPESREYIYDSELQIKVFARRINSWDSPSAIYVFGEDFGQTSQVAASNSEIHTIAYDYENKVIYYYSHHENEIRSVKPDGTQNRLVFRTPGYVDGGLGCLTYFSGKLYWSYSRTLYEYDISSDSLVEVPVWEQFGHSFKIYRGKLYWLQFNKLYRKNLDGSELELVGENIGMGIQHLEMDDVAIVSK